MSADSPHWWLCLKFHAGNVGHSIEPAEAPGSAIKVGQRCIVRESIVLSAARPQEATWVVVDAVRTRFSSANKAQRGGRPRPGVDD